MSAQRRLPVPAHRPVPRAKPLPRQQAARVRLRTDGGALSLEVGGTLDAFGFRGMIDGTFVVEYITPGFTRTAGGATGGLTIRLKPVPVAKVATTKKTARAKRKSVKLVEARAR